MRSISQYAYKKISISVFIYIRSADTGFVFQQERNQFIVQGEFSFAVIKIKMISQQTVAVRPLIATAGYIEIGESVFIGMRKMLDLDPFPEKEVTQSPPPPGSRWMVAIRRFFRDWKLGAKK